jgi:hypothetical protein
VEFIVAGDVASALQGGPLNAIGIAAVYARTELNRPDETHLLTSSHQPLLTRFGPLDLLGTIGNGRSYECLLPHAPEIELKTGLRVQVLSLEELG